MNHALIRTWGVVLAATFAFALGVLAAVEARAGSFLFIPGVPGESQDAQHEDWIDLEKFGQTLEPSKKETSVCQGQAIKRLDRASPALWSAVASGNPFSEMRVEITRPGEMAFLFFQQTMTNVRVARVTFGDMDEQPTETIMLLPQQVTITYTPQNADGSAGTPVVSSVSCTQ